MSRVWVIRAVAVTIACLLVAGISGAVTVNPNAERVVDTSTHHVPSNAALSDETADDAPTTTSEVEQTTTTAPPTSPTTTHPRTTTPPTSDPHMTTHAPTSLQSGIYVVGADGGAARRIVAGTGIHGLSWTPDGARVTYMVNNQVWSAPAAGGPSTPLTPASEFMVDATWSPSGRYLAYGSTDHNSDPVTPVQLMILDTTTGATRGLGDFNWDFVGVAWQDHRDVLVYSNYKEFVFYDATTQQSFSGGLPFPPLSGPLAWSDDGHELACQYQNNLVVITFTDPDHYATTQPFRTVAQSFGPKDPVWIGDRIFFVNPWKLDVAAAAGSDQRNVVADYTGNLRVAAKNPTALFLSIGAPDDVADRHLERAALDGSNRHTIATAIRGHQIQDYAVSPDGSTVAYWQVGE